MKKSNPSKLSLAMLLAAAPAVHAQTTAPDQANLTYTGATTRIGVGFDSEFKGRAELWHVLNATDTSALIGQVWAARHRAGGLQAQYNWLGGSLGDLANARVHKVFAAIDQNSDDARKITIGYGQEREQWHWAAYVSKGLEKDILTGTRDVSSTRVETGLDAAQGPFTQNVITTVTTQTFAKPYDWGIGARAGQWRAAENLRVTAGLDYQWGEDSNKLLAVSIQAEKYFPYTPFSISAMGGIGRQSGDFVTDSSVHFGQVMLRYDLYSKGKWSTLAQGAGWSGPKVTKKMETVTEMRPETKTEMRTEMRDVEVPVQVNVPASAAASTKRSENRVVSKRETKSLETYFDLGKTGLTGKAQNELTGLAAGLKSTPANCRVTVSVAGHTCPTGADRNNVPLSQKRADAVAKYLQNAGLSNASYAITAQAGRAPKYPEVRGQTFRNRRADTDVAIDCDTTETVMVDVPGAVSPARTETRMEKRKESVQVPVQVQVQVPVQVQRETSVSTPVSWLPRALMASVPHLNAVSTYTTQTSASNVVTQPRTYTNQCPNPANDSATVTATTGATVIDVLANDRDPDGNALTIASVSQPANGSAVISGGKVNYTPRAGFSGADTFTYTVTDGFCGTRTATVSVAVPAPAAPATPLQCKAQSYTFKCGTGADIDLSGAVTGGKGPYTYTLPARGIYGIITDNGSGRFRYEANKTICFDREFVTYKATDAAGLSCEGKIELIDPVKQRDTIQ